MNNSMINLCLLSVPPLSAGQTKLGTTRNYNSCVRLLDSVKPWHNECIYVYVCIQSYNNFEAPKRRAHDDSLNSWRLAFVRWKKVFVFIPLTMAYSKRLRKTGFEQSNKQVNRWNLTSDTPYGRWSIFSMYVWVFLPNDNIKYTMYNTCTYIWHNA